jgi:hypothetical protein
LCVQSVLGAERERKELEENEEKEARKCHACGTSNQGMRSLIDQLTALHSTLEAMMCSAIAHDVNCKK